MAKILHPNQLAYLDRFMPATRLIAMEMSRVLGRTVSDSEIVEMVKERRIAQNFLDEAVKNVSSDYSAAWARIEQGVPIYEG